MSKNKSASEILRERLIPLEKKSKANEAFNIHEFEIEAEKVRNTFIQIDDNLQPQKTL